MIQKAQNYSAYSEFLSEFRITPRTQNYSAYSELLSVFTFYEGEPKGEPGTSHLDRPWGVLSAYHALILVHSCNLHRQQFHPAGRQR